MLSSSPFLIECAFFPSWISSFWLLHVQRILGWLIICLHQEVFSSFLTCHVAGSQKDSYADDSLKRNSQQRPLWKIHNDFQGFHHFFAPCVFQSNPKRWDKMGPDSLRSPHPKKIHHPQKLTPYPPLPKPSVFNLTWIILPIPFPKRR